MNRVRTFFIILISTLCIWALMPRPKVSKIEEHLDKKPQVKLELKTVTATTLSKPGALKVSPPAVAKQAGKAEPHTPPAGAVPFDLIHGYVVAYGDVLIGKPTRDDFPKSGYTAPPRLHYWESAEIPFSIHASVTNPDRILRAVTYINQHTPVRFVPYTGQADSIVFVPFDGLCLSYLGKVGGNQPVYLDAHCGDHEIIHELMHALGFIHEQSRTDRDRYVTVNWNNIEPDKQSQFEIAPDFLNEPVIERPFDYHSVMLYPTGIFAVDHTQPVMLPRGDGVIQPVQTGLSPEDIERVRLLYGGR